MNGQLRVKTLGTLLLSFILISDADERALAQVNLGTATSSASPTQPEERTLLGLTGDSYVSESGWGGVRVTRVWADSPATNLRMLPFEFHGANQYILPYRDVITAIDGQRVASLADLRRALDRAGETCQITYFNRSRKLEFRVYAKLR